MKIWFLEERQAQYIPKVIPAPKWILLVRLFQLLGTCSIFGMQVWIIWAYGSGADLFINPPALTLTASAITLLSIPILAPIIPIFRPIYHSWLALALELLCSTFWIASAACLAVLCNFYTTLRGIAYVPYEPLAVSAAVYLTNSTCTNSTQTISQSSLSYYSSGQLNNYLEDYGAGRLAQTTYFTNQQSSPFLNASRAGWKAYRIALASAILCGVMALAFFWTLCCYVWWFVQAYVANAASGTIEMEGGGRFQIEKYEGGSEDSPIDGARSWGKSESNRYTGSTVTSARGPNRAGATAVGLGLSDTSQGQNRSVPGFLNEGPRSSGASNTAEGAGTGQERYYARGKDASSAPTPAKGPTSGTPPSIQVQHPTPKSGDVTASGPAGFSNLDNLAKRSSPNSSKSALQQRKSSHKPRVESGAYSPPGGPSAAGTVPLPNLPGSVASGAGSAKNAAAGDAPDSRKINDAVLQLEHGGGNAGGDGLAQTAQRPISVEDGNVI